MGYGMRDIIGSNPLIQQMNNQGIPLSALSAVSPAAKGFVPDIQIPPMPPQPQRSPMANLPPLVPPQTAPSQPRQALPQKPAVESRVYNSEAQMIIEALMKRLENITKVETKTRKLI